LSGGGIEVRTGQEIQSRLRGVVAPLRESFESKGMEIPGDFNVTLRCTPLAAELVTLSMDPRFAAEFESQSRAGEPLEDPTQYAHQPVRAMPDYVAVALEAVAKYTTGDLGQRLKSIAQNMRENEA
jgi:hypothetical protein